MLVDLSRLALVPVALALAAGSAACSSSTKPVDSGPASSDAHVDAAFGPASVLTGHLHVSRDGAYTDTAFTRKAAAALSLDTSFNATYDGQTFSQPLYVDNFKPGQDALFMVTVTNTVAAFDATTGATLWTTSLGMPVPATDLPCEQPLNTVAPAYGVLSTPVIDPASRTLFTEAFVEDCTTDCDDGAPQKHFVFAISIDDGSVRPGWPVDVGKSVDGFTSIVQHQRGSILLLNGTIYLPYSGIEYDCEPPNFHGWIIGISISDPTKVTSWSTSANRGGIWGAVESDGTDVFFATGNTYELNEPAPAGEAWGGGEALIHLTPDLKFKGDSTAYFTPSNWQAMDTADNDFGSTSPVIFDLPGATPSTLVVAAAKQGTVYVLNRDDLGGLGTGDGVTGEGLFSANIAQRPVFGSPATYTTSKGRYIVLATQANGKDCPAGTTGNLIGLKMAATSPPTFTTAWCASAPGFGSPIVSTTDGESNPIVWVTTAQTTSLLLGFDGDTGEQVFAGGGVTMSGILRWTTPIVAEGRLFVGAAGQLYAFKTP